MKDLLPKGGQIPMEAEKKKHIPSKQVAYILEGDYIYLYMGGQRELGWHWEVQKMWQY